MSNAPSIMTPSSLTRAIIAIQQDIRKIYKRLASNRYVLVGEADDVGASGTTTTAIAKDTAVGDVQFAVAEVNDWYRVSYLARVQSDAAPATVDFQIRDGGASSPTSTSGIIAGASRQVTNTGGAGAQDLQCIGYVQFSVGTHTIAAFFVRTAGSGNVQANQSTGSKRMLIVERVG